MLGRNQKSDLNAKFILELEAQIDFIVAVLKLVLACSKYLLTRLFICYDYTIITYII